MHGAIEGGQLCVRGLLRPGDRGQEGQQVAEGGQGEVGLAGGEREGEGGGEEEELGGGGGGEGVVQEEKAARELGGWMQKSSLRIQSKH